MSTLKVGSEFVGEIISAVFWGIRDAAKFYGSIIRSLFGFGERERTERSWSMNVSAAVEELQRRKNLSQNQAYDIVREQWIESMRLGDSVMAFGNVFAKLDNGWELPVIPNTGRQSFGPVALSLG
jgi:hypothetical protein